MMAAPVGGAGAGVGAIAARDNNPLHAYQQQLQASQAALGQHPSYQGMRVADVIDYDGGEERSDALGTPWPSLPCWESMYRYV